MKVLFIGLGGVGQRHLRNLRSILGSDLEVLAYRTRRLQQVITPTLTVDENKSLESEFDIRVFTDLDDALRQRPEAAVIANPTSLHQIVALRAAQSGCHLFIEKPVSHSFEGMSELRNALGASGKKGVVAYQLRFHPCLRKLRELVRSGLLGKILALRVEIGEHLPSWHPYEDYRQMYASREDLGGGVILSQIHEFDYLYWLLGMPVRLFSVGGKLSSLEIDVEDTASTLMEFQVGGLRIPVHLHQDYVQRPPSRTCQVIGDAGKAILDFRIPSLSLYGADGTLVDSMKIDQFDRNSMFLNEMKSFLSHINGDSTEMATLEDGLCSLRMALAAKQAIQSGELVEMDRFLTN